MVGAIGSAAVRPGMSGPRRGVAGGKRAGRARERFVGEGERSRRGLASRAPGFSPGASGASGPPSGSQGATRHGWVWRGHRCEYVTAGCGATSIVLVHGFGASSGQWRDNVPAVAAAGYKVYAVDLLGFGGSAKPDLAAEGGYSTALWAAQLQDFVQEFVGSNGQAVLVGNSIGSIASLMAVASASTVSTGPSSIRGLCLVNCAIGMNSKAVVDEQPIFAPLFWLIDFIFRTSLGRRLFERTRDRENLRKALRGVYASNQARVDDALVNQFAEPALQDGAYEAFAGILTGAPGPRPERLALDVDSAFPLLLLWGEQDRVTPLSGPVGRFFAARADDPRATGTSMVRLPGLGHCPMDEDPDVFNPPLLAWLAHQFPSASA